MASFECFISLIVLINVKYDSVYVKCADVENRQLGGVSIPNARNISSHDDVHVVGSVDDDGTQQTLSMVSGIFSDIQDSPIFKIITRVYELYRTHTEQREIISNVLSSVEMRKLIDGWLTWSDVSPDVITAVQSLVSSHELITVIDVLMYNYSTSTSEQLSVVHNFSKLPEFRQVFTMFTSLAANTTVSHLSSLGNLTGVQDMLNDRLPDLKGLQHMFSQLRNVSIGNGTIAHQEFVGDLVQEVNNSLVAVVHSFRLFTEKFFHEILKKNGISTSCRESSFAFLQAFLAGESWTLQVIDAMGKLPRDLSDAGTLWLGNFDECTSVSSSNTGGSEPFDGKYCRATIPNPGLSPMYGSKLTLGTCVPSTCSATDTIGLLLTVQKLLLNVSTHIVPSINCVEDRVFGNDAVIVTCILIIIVFIVVCGTIYDVVFVQPKSRRTGSNDAISGTRDGSYEITSSPNHTDYLYKPIKAELRTSPAFANTGDELGKQPITVSEEENIEYRTITESGNVLASQEDSDKHFKGIIKKIMLSFSAYTNSINILSTKQPSGAFGAIYGIRFLSMAWVILGHTVYFARGYHDNLEKQYDEQTNYFMFSVVVYSTVSVDSFFSISGILLGYLTFRQLEKVGGAKHMNWVRFYFHRYWRLTPSYMLVIMAATVLLPFVATGPLWEEDIPGMQGCRKYWWTNLLYINNFVNIYPDTNMCAVWTWYLASDMQFYILSPLIILPLFYNVVAGIASCAVFLAATITATVILVHKYEYPAQMFNLAYAPTSKDDYILQRIYFPCYTRMGPYIMGLLTGYLLYRLKSTCRIPKALNLLCWFVCLAICTLCVFGPYSYKDYHILTQLQSEVFHALHRTGWGVAICWIVFACATGNGGWIHDLLSWRPFIPLGKLTYAAYLVHPIVISIFYTSRRFPANFTDYVLYLFVGHVVLSYGAAFITCLIFESPMMGLEKVIFGNHRK